MHNIMRLYGIDGCHAGWVAAAADPDLKNFQISVVTDLRPILASGSLIAIDIPIGIPNDVARACDGMARRLLGSPRSSSVFSPPMRLTLSAHTYEQAKELNRAAAGIAISKQAFNIMPKIRQVDELMSAATQRHVHEVHPEVTFAQLNGGPLLYSKKLPEGRQERLALLNRAGLRVSLEPRVAPLDDQIDACACLVTAAAIYHGRSHALGRADQTDDKGLAMEIVTVCSTEYTCRLCTTPSSGPAATASENSTKVDAS
jgi:predicted RNase H-like nuclease